MIKQMQKPKKDKLLNIRLLFIMVSMGEIFGTLEIVLTLHVANMWSTGG